TEGRGMEVTAQPSADLLAQRRPSQSLIAQRLDRGELGRVHLVDAPHHCLPPKSGPDARGHRPRDRLTRPILAHPHAAKNPPRGGWFRDAGRSMMWPEADTRRPANG